MKPFNVARRFGASIRTGYRNACLAIVTSLPLLAAAQETDPFMIALDEASDKIGEYAAALVGVAAVAVVFMIGVKYVKKIRGAA